MTDQQDLARLHGNKTIALDLELLRAEAKRLREYAEKPENFYRLGKEAPGFDENFVCETTDGLRLVYSITINTDGKPWKHLSVSYQDTPPGMAVLIVISRLFGFTRPIGNENSQINDQDNCAVVVEPYVPEDAHEKRG